MLIAKFTSGFPDNGGCLRGGSKGWVVKDMIARSECYDPKCCAVRDFFPSDGFLSEWKRGNLTVKVAGVCLA